MTIPLQLLSVEDSDCCDRFSENRVITVTKPSLASETKERKMNEANWDRIGRLVVGIVLLVIGFTVLSGAISLVAIIPGIILTATGAIGWCPIYAVLKTGTLSLIHI